MLQNNFTSTILVVEDDLSLNHLLQIKLQELGYETEGYETGEDALKRIKNDPDVLLLVDYNLTDMLAVELVNELKENKIHIPFIVMTGNGDEKLAVEMMRMGALDYIVKDLGFIEHISAIINRSLQHFETRHKLNISQEEIKKNEEKYRSIFENIQDVYFEMDESGLITEISPSAQTLLKYQRKEILGMMLNELIPDNKELALFENEIADKLSVRDRELVIRKKTGEMIDCAINASLRKTKNNQVIIVGTIRDISLRKKLERQLINKVIETEEKERRRFSEDIHDGLGPLLSSIKLYVNMLTNASEDEKRKQLAEYSNELLDEAISNTRSIANNLMPNVLADYGLIPALEAFCKKLSTTGQIKIHFESNFSNRINNTTEIVLYRSVMEMINNTLKHAEAKNIWIEFNLVHTNLHVSYKDDGVGFDVDEKLLSKTGGQGLNNIFNRIHSINGKCDFKSEKGKGLIIHIDIILPSEG